MILDDRTRMRKKCPRSVSQWQNCKYTVTKQDRKHYDINSRVEGDISCYWKKCFLFCMWRLLLIHLVHRESPITKTSIKKLSTWIILRMNGHVWTKAYAVLLWWIFVILVYSGVKSCYMIPLNSLDLYSIFN